MSLHSLFNLCSWTIEVSFNWMALDLWPQNVSSAKVFLIKRTQVPPPGVPTLGGHHIIFVDLKSCSVFSLKANGADDD